MDLNSMDIFLEYNWLVKYNSEVDWKIRIIQFTRYPKNCRTQHYNIPFKNKIIQLTNNQNKGQQEIGKEPDLTNPEDLLEYIESFTHLFNKEKFDKLLERQK